MFDRVGLGVGVEVGVVEQGTVLYLRVHVEEHVVQEAVVVRQVDGVAGGLVGQGCLVGVWVCGCVGCE